MKRRMLAFGLSVLVAASVWSQSNREKADMLLRQTVEAMGGAEALAALKSLSTRAECHGMDGLRFTLEIQSMSDRTHLVQKAHDDVLEVTVVGDLAWRRDPSTGKLALMDPYVPAQIRQRAIHWQLFGLGDRFTDHVFGGKEFNSGKSCLRIEFRDRWGRPASACINEQSSLPLRLRLQQPPEMGAGTVVAVLQEWVQAGDIMYAADVTIRRGQQTFVYRYDFIEANAVDPDLFEIPPEIQQQAKERDAARR